MFQFSRVPIEQLLRGWWGAVDPSYRRAFVVAACVSVLAFGFEMTNLILHHDDLVHLMVQKPLVGYYLGRFIHAWLFFYVQQGHFLPFLDMAVGIVLMSAYGVLVAHFWGARRTLDVALVASIVCVFPYMAHVYQYNSVMVAYPLAHLLAACAVVLSARARAISTAVAALLFFLAFSIYQAVLANAATVFLVWLLVRVAFAASLDRSEIVTMTRAAVAALVAVAIGGILHVIAVSSFDIPFDSAQGADQAFSLKSRLENGLQLSYATSQVLQGTRAFFFWPENYFPLPIKRLQQVLLAGLALGCLLIPRGRPAKIAALTLLGLVLIAPRAMQFLHPQGTFHSLTLTAYALVIAAAALVIVRSGHVLVRNAAAAVTFLLLAGYVAQCNWISTVNYLNTMAHYSTVTQILARLRSMPEKSWDGKTVVVVGSYDMPSEFPYRPGTGVATEFMTPGHMTLIARLLRDETRFVRPDATLPGVMDFAASRKPWPHPGSVGVVDGVGVVVLSTPAEPNPASSSK